MSNIIIDVATDGTPIFLRIQGLLKLCTILGSLSKNIDNEPFLIGAYGGNKDPKFSDNLLTEFCEEVNYPKSFSGGVLIKNHTFVNVKQM